MRYPAGTDTPKTCECDIGVFYNQGEAHVVSYQDMISVIKQNRTFNSCISEREKTFTRLKPTNIMDYLDGKHPKEFRRFKFCPECGVNLKKFFAKLDSKK